MSAKVVYPFPMDAGDNSTTVWLTPPEIIGQLGPFVLDPCAAVGQPWRTAEFEYNVYDDGLVSPWFGLVWCNPPYGQGIELWLDKCAEHGNALALVYGRTDTAVFHRSVFPKAMAIFFLEGRLNFYNIKGERAKTNGGAPSVLIAYGAVATQRLAACKLKGTLIYLNTGINNNQQSIAP
jgi:hypothetical protein